MHPSIKKPSIRLYAQLGVALLVSLAAGLGIYAARADRAGRLAPRASQGVSAWHLGRATTVSAANEGRPDQDAGTPDGQRSGSGRHADDASFSIRGQAAGVLYPGGASQPIALTISNPNSFAIQLTSLQTTVAGGSAGCPAAGNLVLTQSNATASSPLRVTAHGSVTLPAQGISAPAIRMADRPVNQDACRSATFLLSYTGSARS
jgi:hypothetical protein